MFRSVSITAFPCTVLVPMVSIEFAVNHTFSPAGIICAVSVTRSDLVRRQLLSMVLSESGSIFASRHGDETKSSGGNFDCRKLGTIG